MSEHTKGVWSIDEDGDVVCGGYLIAIVPSGLHTDEERPANARLIAAAPAMLEALKAALERLELMESHRGFPNVTTPAIRAVIAAAEGES